MTGRALITGAAGFAGRRLADHLQARGWEVVRSGYPPAAGMLPCDIADPDSVARLIAAAGDLTHVFHLAAIAFVPDAERNPARTMAVNLNGTIHLCNVLQGLPRPPRLIFVGSADAYGPPQFLPVTESHPMDPANAYAISKAAADHFCATLAQRGPLSCVRLRPFNHAGPGQPEQYVLSSFARQIAAIEAGREAPVLHVGNLLAARDFLHVDDVLRAYELAALHGASGAAYNICSGSAIQIQEALERLLSMSTTKIAVREDPARLRPSDVPEVRGSHDQFTAATGWRPEISIDTLLRELLAYWRGELGVPTA